MSSLIQPYHGTSAVGQLMIQYCIDLAFILQYPRHELQACGTVPWSLHSWILPGFSWLEHMLVSITLTCQCNISWDLHFFPVSWLCIPVSWLCIPVSWLCIHVSWLRIPVSGPPCLFLMRISSTAPWKTLLSHSYQMLSLYFWNVYRSLFCCVNAQDFSSQLFSEN